MRLKAFIISLLAFLSAPSAYGCSIDPCTPQEYLLYRVYNVSGKKVSHLEIKPLDARILSTQEGKDYMDIAHMCEAAIMEQNTRWYYPSRNDEVRSALEEVIRKSLAYNGKLLKDRYALQAARAMFALGYHTRLIEWWNEVERSLPGGVVKENIKGYVAGSLFRTGEQQKAINYYVAIEDLESLIWCMDKMGIYRGDMSVLDYAASNFPDNRYIPQLMQEYFTWVEIYKEDYLEDGSVDECYSICMKAANNPLCKNPDRWLYTAAFLKNLKGQHHIASHILSRAEKCNSDSFMTESIRYFRILLDAQTRIYDKEYECRLLADLAWADGKMQDDLTEEIVLETSRAWNLTHNYSYYYRNDMVKKILLGTVVPRMEEAGKTPLALLLANYADNRLLGLSEDYANICYTKTEVRRSGGHNDFDYRSSYFKMMDTVQICHLKKYHQLVHDPVSPLEQFLCSRAYLPEDYLNDLIGTRYLRAMDYRNAIKYLGMVSDKYQSQMNVDIYLWRDPFEYDQKCYIHKKSNFRLYFARKMLEYERMAVNGNPDDMGKAMVMMGIGLRSAYGFCWALTQYSYREGDLWIESKETRTALARSEELIEKGLRTIVDPELAAECNLKLFRYLTVVKDYRDTKTAEQLLEKCDRLRDYVGRY